jgi:hypothetical protein
MDFQANLLWPKRLLGEHRPGQPDCKLSPGEGTAYEGCRLWASLSYEMGWVFITVA